MSEEENETPKKSTRKRTATKKVEKSLTERKREDAKKRLEAKKKAGGGFGLDVNDPLVGWDAQQGKVRPVEG